MRCLDLGYVPFNSNFLDRAVKLHGHAHDTADHTSNIQSIQMQTTLGKLNLFSLLPLLVKNALVEITQMENQINAVETQVSVAASRVDEVLS